MHKRNQRRPIKALSVFMAAALVFTSFPSEAKTGKKKEVTQIQLTSPYSAKDKKITTTLTMKKGSTFKIKASVFPKSAGKKLVFKSSKKKIASVSKSGKIKANKVGKANITVQPQSNKKVKAVINVTVVNKLKKVKKITLDKSSLSLSVNGTAQLNASVVSPKKPTSKKFNWFTSNADVAVVNNKGTVTAKAPGSADITATSADGQGAKAVCRVTVTEGSTPVPTGVPSAAPSAVPGIHASAAPASQTPGAEPSGSPADPSESPASPSGSPAAPSASPSSVPAEKLAVSIPGSRTGIKQGESIQLAAAGPGADQVTWSVSGASGVTISATGLLTASANAGAGKKIQVKAETSADVPVKSASASLTVAENRIQPLTEDRIQLNKDTEEHPLGLTYRSKKAWSRVSDPERGEVVRIDTSVDYVNDMLAWMQVDPLYAGKEVKISAYIKYDKVPDHDTIGIVLNERWKYSNPAAKWNAEPDTWYYVNGSFNLPHSNYNGDKNNIFLSRFTGLKDGENAVYYIDQLVISVEKSEVEGVTVTTKDDETEVYQNHTLQCSAEVSGKNHPSQKVAYSIEPAVEGASIDEDGLLTVKNAAAGSEITVKAVSVEDPEKFGTTTVRVLEQTVDSVTITAPGKVTKIYPGKTLQFSADVKTTGDPEMKLTWKIDPELNGVSISEKGLLEVSEQEEGTVITIKATAEILSDPSKTKTATYKVTVLGDYVEPHEVKAIKANQWDAFTEDYYCNLKYDETEGSCYFENGSTDLATGSKRSCVGFLINSDGSSFDASVYNTLTIRLKSNAAEGTTNARTVKLNVYSKSDTGYSASLPSVRESGISSRDRVWRIPTSKLAEAGISLVDMKALSLSSTTTTAGGIKIYSFTFENLSEYEPYTVKIEQPGKLKQVKEQRSIRLDATAKKQNGEELENINFIWKSSDENVATVSDDGTVTGVAAGEVTITAAAAGSNATGFYDITVYDDTPAGSGVQFGSSSYGHNEGANNRIYCTAEELSDAAGGIPLKAVQLNAGNEAVGESQESLSVTFNESNNRNLSSYSYQDGVLKAALADGKDEGTVSATVTVGETTVKLYIMICTGHRIPITSSTVYNASAGKQKEDIRVSDGYAVIAAKDDGISGIGFKGALPSGKTLKDYKSVLVIVGSANEDYPFSLYMPANGWDADTITCTEDDSKLASDVQENTSFSSDSEVTFPLLLDETEAATSNIHLAVGFDGIRTGDLSIKNIILLE